VLISGVIQRRIKFKERKYMYKQMIYKDLESQKFFLRRDFLYFATNKTEPLIWLHLTS